MIDFISVAKAADISLQIPFLENTATQNPTDWIVSFYKFALYFSGILAFGAIVFGGFLYATSAGNAGRQGDGRAWITSALIGLLLLAGAYVILNTINPNLTSLQLPITSVNTPSPTNNQTYGPKTCGGTVNAPCPNGQTCKNNGDALHPNYSCQSITSFTCGGTHIGDCPGTESCINGSSDANAPNYYCSTQ